MVNMHPGRIIGLALRPCYKKQLCFFHDKAIASSIMIITLKKINYFKQDCIVNDIGSCIIEWKGQAWEKELI